MLKKSLATLGLLALLNIPLFSQENSKTDSLLVDFFIGKNYEKAALVAKDTLIDITFRSINKGVEVDTTIYKEVVEKYDTLSHTHNHIEDIHSRAVGKKLKRAIKKIGEEKLENRLISKIPSRGDISYVLFSEQYALKNDKKYEYLLVVTKEKEAEIYEYGLTQPIKDTLKTLSEEERAHYCNHLYYKYEGLLLNYFEDRCHVWEMGNCKEPSNQELTDLINQQGIVFIGKKEN